MDETVLREIIARIMSDPRLQPLLAAGATKNKETSLIVIENEAGLRALPEIQKRWGCCSELQLCLAGPVSHTAATMPQISCEQAMQFTTWSRIIIPFCSAPQLGEIALGFHHGKVTELAAWAILQGIPVEIGCVEYGFTAKTPEAYRRRLEGYAEQVAAYGVKIGDMQPSQPAAQNVQPLPPSLPWTFGEPVHSPEPESRSSIAFEKILMTEKEAILLPEHAVLTLKKSTVLTPSAIDVLKRQKVQVYKEGVRFL